jgi:hypothetical protein
MKHLLKLVAVATLSALAPGHVLAHDNNCIELTKRGMGDGIGFVYFLKNICNKTIWVNDCLTEPLDDPKTHPQAYAWACSSPRRDITLDPGEDTYMRSSDAGKAYFAACASGIQSWNKGSDFPVCKGDQSVNRSATRIAQNPSKEGSGGTDQVDSKSSAVDRNATSVNPSSNTTNTNANIGLKPLPHSVPKKENSANSTHSNADENRDKANLPKGRTYIDAVTRECAHWTPKRVEGNASWYQIRNSCTSAVSVWIDEGAGSYGSMMELAPGKSKNGWYLNTKYSGVAYIACPSIEQGKTVAFDHGKLRCFVNN